MFSITNSIYFGFIFNILRIFYILSTFPLTHSNAFNFPLIFQYKIPSSHPSIFLNLSLNSSIFASISFSFLILFFIHPFENIFEGYVVFLSNLSYSFSRCSSVSCSSSFIFRNLVQPKNFFYSFISIRLFYIAAVTFHAFLFRLNYFYFFDCFLRMTT